MAIQSSTTTTGFAQAGTRRQLLVFALLVLVYASLAFLAVASGLQNQAIPGQEMPPELAAIPPWLLGLANGGLVLVFYGLLGLAGYGLARYLGLPGIYRAGAGWRNGFAIPLALGVLVGGVLIVLDRLFASAGGWTGLAHPAFPLSLIASAAAGIGEEILFRLFVLSLWAGLLNLILGRWQLKRIALWTGNGIAALAFAAGHLPSLMMLTGVASPAGIPPLLLVEVFLLNGLMGLVAGERYMRDGLVAAAGVHFWADVVWHVIWPLMAVA